MRLAALATLDNQKGGIMVASMREYSDGRDSEASEISYRFNFTEFFHGHTRASGWFSDRFGRPRRHFCGDFHGSFDGELFHLDEKLFYTDGVRESRLWKVSITEDGMFTAQSDSLIGEAIGLVKGNCLSMKYTMEVKVEENNHWVLDMKDSMILQPDGSLHNITQVYKWGIRIGTVSTQYQHHDGRMLCADLPHVANS